MNMFLLSSALIHVSQIEANSFHHFHHFYVNRNSVVHSSIIILPPSSHQRKTPSDDRVRLIVRVIRAVGELPNHNITLIIPEILLDRRVLHSARTFLLAESLHSTDIATSVVNPDLVDSLPAGITIEVVQRREGETCVSS